MLRCLSWDQGDCATGYRFRSLGSGLSCDCCFPWSRLLRPAHEGQTGTINEGLVVQPGSPASPSTSWQTCTRGHVATLTPGPRKSGSPQRDPRIDEPATPARTPLHHAHCPQWAPSLLLHAPVCRWSKLLGVGARRQVPGRHAARRPAKPKGAAPKVPNSEEGDADGKPDGAASSSQWLGSAGPTGLDAPGAKCFVAG
jgi:hypothetical protein